MKCIDLFAGLGGFTLAAVRSGHRVVWAANHWRTAYDFHRLNHPDVMHSCQDLQQADFTLVPRHEAQLASPACQGHTPARGREREHHDAMRATAWAVVTAAECHRPRVVIVENVPGFTNWTLFPAWKAAMQALGYKLAFHVLDAADFGVPQHRVRLFVVASLQGALKLHFKASPHVAARTFLDMDGGKWNAIRKPGRSPATLRRIANGRKEFGAEFLIPFYSRGSGLTGRSLDRPIGTITTRERWGIVRRNEMRMLTADETRAAMGFPESYCLPPSKKLATHLLGNAVPPPQAAAVIRAVTEQLS